jgi:trans-AT polyketide synthase/acyltransferase/oxidoreductase domain-containing protein
MEFLNSTDLGSKTFKLRYNATYAYATGGMYGGIASADMVIAMCNAGYLSFLGAGGIKLNKLNEQINYIKANTYGNTLFGVNFLHSHIVSEKDDKLVQLLIDHNIRVIEAAAFSAPTEALVKFKLAGIRKNKPNFIIAKNSRMHIARAFMQPPTEEILARLTETEQLTAEELLRLRTSPVADDIIVESDSAGHTDRRVALVTLPALVALRDEIQQTYQYPNKINVGAAGGLGTPQAIAAALTMGADFIVTGSVNQCTVESGANNTVKDILQKINIEDTDYCPSGDMFEEGGIIQVLRKGVLFPVRAKKMHELYTKFNSLEELDEDFLETLENKYFGKSLDEVWDDIKTLFNEEQVQRAQNDAKHKLALILKMYFYYSVNHAVIGNSDQKINYQIHTGSALGAFNSWVKGSEFENWENRNVADIASYLLNHTANYLNNKYNEIYHGKSTAIEAN